MAKSRAEKSERKLVSRREFLVGGGAVIAAIALTACGTKTTTSSPSTSVSSATTATTPTSVTSTSTQQTSTTPSTSTVTPKYGGTIRYISPTMTLNSGWPSEPTINQQVTQNMCDTLLRGDYKGNIIPWLAESYKVADDQKSITFSLRKGVKFHDQSDFNASVAKWNLDNFIDAKMQDHWASVDVIDDSTIRVNFIEWQNTLLSTFVEPTFPAFMISKAAFDKNGIDWMRQHPVGTGPFIFDSFVQDVSYKVKKNPDYWVKGKPYLDGIDYTIIGDASTRKMAMKAGDGDVMMGIVAMDMADLAAAGFPVIPTRIGLVNGLVPDTADADSPWANQKVREAVEYAIDKEGIDKAFGYGYGVAPYQIVPPVCSLAYNPDFTLGRKFDLDQAKQLLADAGYSNGFDTTITVLPTANRNIVSALQGNLAKVGIKVNLDFPDQGKWAANYMSPKGTWPKAALYYGIPSVSGADFSLGLQFLFNMLGTSWQRPPELAQAYQAFLSSPTVEIDKVRGVTDLITKEALIIPTDAIATGSVVKDNNVFISVDQRSSQLLYSTEDWWLNT